MSDVLRTLLLALLGGTVFLSVAVLPGMRLADRLARPGHSLVARLILSLALSQVLIAGTAFVLIGLGRFSGIAVGVVTTVLVITSLPVLVRWVREARAAAPLAGLVILLAVPWVVFAGAGGWPPADTLQWYYSGLGNQLTTAAGVPDSVAEWGLHLRWLPDYLVFNVGSEAYLSLLGFLPRADALAAWRVPVVIAGLLLLVAVLRLWVSRPVAVAGAICVAGTTFFLAKFDAYKPEAYGIVLGLAALWLVVMGVRHGRRSWILLGGAALGLDLAVHAIAATVMAFLVVGFAVAELLARREERRTAFGWLVRAAALGLLLSVVLGIGLQGRPLVATSAMNPATVGDDDPTWTFFLRSTGNFVVPEPPPPRRPLAGGVTTPWPGLRLTSAFGWWLIPFVGIGLIALAYLGGRRARSGLLGLAGGTTLLVLGIGFFAVAFDTYVPRWTGLVRFGQYLPLLAGLGVAFAMAGYLRAWSWLAQVRVPRQLLPLVAAAGVLWLVPSAFGRYAAETRISAPGRAAMEEVRLVARPGDVILSNALTTGTLEFFTGVEAPLEGRQPLIEEPDVLAAANDLLLDAHAWFAQPDERTFLDDLGVHWILAVEEPSALGASATLGGSPAALDSVAYLHRVWSDSGVALYEVMRPNTAAAVVDIRSTTPDLTNLAAAIALGLLGGALLILPVPRSWRRRAGPSVPS